MNEIDEKTAHRNKLLNASFGALKETHDQFMKALDTHPDNGKEGYWYVDGVRHGGAVWTDHARKAVERAEHENGALFIGDVKYLGERPEVIWW